MDSLADKFSFELFTLIRLFISYCNRKLSTEKNKQNHFIKFGIGIIVPLIKDRHGDVRNSENYRAITISSVISKVFEICLYDKMEQFLHTDELQYGFKPGYGCNTAVFTLQHVVNYFRARQSNVYMSAIDASKAFDRINHQKLISKLIQRQLPTCFLNIFVNWYSKLYSCVRWNGVLSSCFKVLCGVRQGGILSPILFNIYVNDLIDSLRVTNVGCSICNVFMGCIMYADDLILISPWWFTEYVNCMYRLRSLFRHCF